MRLDSSRSNSAREEMATTSFPSKLAGIRSAKYHAAIDVDVLPGDGTAQVRAQEAHGGGDVLGRQGAAQGRLGEDALARLVHGDAQGARHVVPHLHRALALHRAGAHSVDTDVV